MRECARSRHRSWVITASTLLGACAPERPVQVCEYWVLPAIAVEAADANTGAALTTTVSGVVRDGAYSDSLQLCTMGMYPGTRCAALERPGTYDVEVRHQGYHTWTTRGVAVTNGPCHVNTVVLQAKLSKEP
jgi:hypothetical protein